MRTTAQVATEFVESSVTVCSLFDALVDGEYRARSPYTPESGSPRPTSEALVAELRIALKRFAEEVIAEYESKGSEMRTTFKYEPEDVL